MDQRPVDEQPGSPARLTFIRDETRFELGLLHERVNALVGAEAFLTIAFTAAMSNGTPWGARFAAVVSPILSLLGLVLALLAWPGIAATVRIIVGWTATQADLLDRDPALGGTVWALVADTEGAARTSGRQSPGRQSPRRQSSRRQWRGMLFFRTVPPLFAAVWAALTVIALLIHP